MDKLPEKLKDDTVEALRRRIGNLDRHQIAAWRRMSPGRRLELAFQAYRFALGVVRLTERRNHPDLPPHALAWRVTRRMQGNPTLGGGDTEVVMEPPGDNELKGFLAYVIAVLERLGIPYMVVGGFAAILYGEPRLTVDVDIVVDMKREHIKPLVAAFQSPNFYVSEEGVRDSLQRRHPFNVIQPATGAKVDLVPLPCDAFTRGAFQRHQRLDYDESGYSATFITAEDIILAKLNAFRETGSDKHLRDVRGVLVTQWGQLDLETVRRMARAADALEQFEELLEAARREIEE